MSVALRLLSELFELSKARLKLDVQAHGDGVAMIVGDSQRTDGGTDLCRGCRVEYQFEISVPTGALVDVGTVTDGRIEITGVRGPVNASNVNGPVAVRDLSNCSNIESVNGALDVVFAGAPGEDCSIKTINGRITVGLPANAGLDAILNVTQGDIESDFDVESLTPPTRLEKAERDDRFGYRLEQPAGGARRRGRPDLHACIAQRRCANS